MSPMLRWAPAALLLLGVGFVEGLDQQRRMPLRADLAAALPPSIAGYAGDDIAVPEKDLALLGASDYLLRVYSAADTAASRRAAMSVFVGYYDHQTRGRTIHSPKNCLPGAGWEPLVSRRETLVTAAGPITVNRYLLQRGDQRALVLYWYQGRGRVAANEYAVKWDLLRDSALRGRSDEALVRVLVPITGDEREAFELAAGAARAVVPALYAALPI